MQETNVSNTFGTAKISDDLGSADIIVNRRNGRLCRGNTTMKENFGGPLVQPNIWFAPQDFHKTVSWPVHLRLDMILRGVETNSGVVLWNR